MEVAAYKVRERSLGEHACRGREIINTGAAGVRYAGLVSRLRTAGERSSEAPRNGCSEIVTNYVAGRGGHFPPAAAPRAHTRCNYKRGGGGDGGVDETLRKRCYNFL